MLVMVVFSFLAIIIGTILLTSYFSGSVSAQQNQNNDDIENNLESSLDRINYLMSQSNADKEELRQLKYELEDALNKLREQKTKTRVVYITNGGY